MFIAEGVVAQDDVQDAVGAAGLGVFLRALTGLDRAAAKQMFSDFISQNALTANQTEFVDLIIDSLTEAGMVDPALFYESPFTDIDDMGISGLFKDEDTRTIVGIVQRINASAAA